MKTVGENFIGVIALITLLIYIGLGFLTDLGWSIAKIALVWKLLVS